MSFDDFMNDANSVFFDTEFGAEEVTYQPNGSSSEQFTVNAVVDWGDEEGNNQIRGDGRSSLNSTGRAARSSVVVELPKRRCTDDGEEVELIVRENGKDKIIINRHGRGVPVHVKRIVGQDLNAQSVLCSRTKEFIAGPRKTRIG